jgi:nucleoside-diphosphate-sugar epimerase
LKEKIIITGGSGFLAKNLLNHINKEKFEVILLTRSKKKKIN